MFNTVVYDMFSGKLNWQNGETFSDTCYETLPTHELSETSWS